MSDNLADIARSLVAKGKGILAADESSPTCAKRFDLVGIECTEETRREYRELLLTTPEASQHMSGVIHFDETFWQSTDSQTFPEYLKSQNIIPGIKVDKGLIPLDKFEGEKISQGLDGLKERMDKYFESGARFAKWRSVIAIGDGIPTPQCIQANAFVLTRYAAICQAAGIVPIVEPEVLYDGTHTIDSCYETIIKVYDALFGSLREYRVDMSGVILKTSMVLPGKTSGISINYDEVAEKTVKALHEHLPQDLGGVVFLSGGQTSNDAFINLNRIAKLGPHPWGLTFSYSRALQDPVLKLWAKDRENKKAVQELFANQLRLAGAASLGELNESELHDNTEATKSQDL